MSANLEDQPVAVFRRVGPKSKAAAIRKREKQDSDSNGSDNDRSEAVSSTKDKRIAKKKSKMTQSTRRQRINDSGSSDSSDGETKPKFDINVKYASTGVGKAGPSDMGATARTEHDTEHSQDAQALFERTQKQLTEAAANQEPGSSKEKIYRGQAMYGASIKSDTAKGNAASGLNRLGPIRATQYMRSSVRWDYAPDICKDYKETGFCTFGDSCKFLHDRSDYKHGWELERDWEAGKLTEAKDDEFLIESDEDNDELPFACHICREDFKSPVMTKCNHYFCESCAMKNCKTKCAICGAKTNGQLSVAKTLLKKLKELKQREAEKEKEQQLEENSGDEELPSETEMENAEEPEIEAELGESDDEEKED